MGICLLICSFCLFLSPALMFSHEIDDAEVRGDKITDGENTVKLILRLYLERRTRPGLFFPETIMFCTSGNSMLDPRKNVCCIVPR